MILWQVQAAAQEAADSVEVHVVAAVAAHVAVFQEVQEVLAVAASAEVLAVVVFTEVDSTVGIIPHQDIITDQFSTVATMAVAVITTIITAEEESFLLSSHSL